MAKTEATAPNVDVEALNRRLSELEAERDEYAKLAEQAEARASVAEANAGSEGGAGPKLVAPAGKPIWRFLVRCTGKPERQPWPKSKSSGKHREPKPKTDIDQDEAALALKCVDESEAKRMYCLLHTDNDGNELDPANYRLQVHCLDEDERQDAINRKKAARLQKVREAFSLGVRPDQLPAETTSAA